jgi:hypothetical protein
MALYNGIEAGTPAGIAAMAGEDRSPTPKSNEVASAIFLIQASGANSRETIPGRRIKFHPVPRARPG